MKKKSLLTMVASLALVGALGVGATLAYMSARSETVTNTFTFATSGITITLDEAKVDPVTNKATDESRVTSQAYRNIIPGMVIDKDPTVTIGAGSLKCNVFVSVQENEDMVNNEVMDVLTIADMSENWWEVDPEDYGLESDEHTRYYVYLPADYAYDPTNEDNLYVVDATGENAVVLDDVFEHVTISSDLTENDNVVFGDIVVKAAAVQADNCSDYDAAVEALKMLGARERI